MNGGKSFVSIHSLWLRYWLYSRWSPYSFLLNIVTNLMSEEISHAFSLLFVSFIMLIYLFSSIFFRFYLQSIRFYDVMICISICLCFFFLLKIHLDLWRENARVTGEVLIKYSILISDKFKKTSGTFQKGSLKNFHITDWFHMYDYICFEINSQIELNQNKMAFYCLTTRTWREN